MAQQVAFYGSTPAYRGVLELHGWGELQTELNTLSKKGEWVEMGKRITDDMLDEFAIVSEPQGVAKALSQRYGGLVDRILCAFPFASVEERKGYMEELRAA